MKIDPFPIDHGHPPDAKPSFISSTGWHLQVLFVVIAVSMVVFQPRNEAFTTFSIIFSSIILEAFPFMLLGTLFGGFIEVFLERERLVQWLPKNKRLAIAASAFLGIIFPVCECAIVPVVRKFIQKGLPLGSAVAFLLGGPIVNPLVFGSTLVAYSFSIEIALYRIIMGAGIAMAIGIFIDSIITRKQALVPVSTMLDCGCHHADCSHHHHDKTGMSFSEKIQSAVSHGAADFYDIGRFLIIGAFIAAALQTMVPRTFFMSIVDNPMAGIGAMMVLAVVLNLCSEADAFIAASFQPIGIAVSGQLAFMVLGPMLDIKLILMYLNLFSRKMIVILIILVSLFVFLAASALEVSQWVVS